MIKRKPQSIRRRLLADHVLLILLLGGAILATTFGGARQAVETLSRGIDRTALIVKRTRRRS